jgi:hypothetical protein
VTAIGGDRAHTFVVIGKRARDSQFAATAVFRRFARGRGVLGRCFAAGAFLGAGFFFFFVDGLAAMAGGVGVNRRGGFFLFESARGFFFGVSLGQFVGGFARVLFGFALFGGGAFDGQTRFFDGAMLGFFLGAFARFQFFDAGAGKGAAARDFFFFGELAKHHTARNLLIALSLRLADLRLADFRLLRLWRFGDLGHFARSKPRALLLHDHGFAAAMAEALFDGRCFRLFQRQRLAPLRAGLACRVVRVVHPYPSDARSGTSQKRFCQPGRHTRPAPSSSQ